MDRDVDTLRVERPTLFWSTPTRSGRRRCRARGERRRRFGVNRGASGSARLGVGAGVQEGGSVAGSPGCPRVLAYCRDRVDPAGSTAGGSC